METVGMRIGFTTIETTLEVAEDGVAQVADELRTRLIWSPFCNVVVEKEEPEPPETLFPFTFHE